jgi:Dolichyl-phosphate-mannose-protein mannosyltransferase
MRTFLYPNSPLKFVVMLARRRTLLLPALLGSFVFIVYIFTFPNDLQGNGDTQLRLQTAQSIVENGTLYYSLPGTPTWRDKRVVLGVGRKLYSIYDLGQIVSMAPLALFGKVLAHHVTHDYTWTPRYTSYALDDILGALLAIVFFLIALRLGYSRRVAALLTLIYAFASVAWPDAESFLEHTQVTFFLALAILLSIVFVQHGMRRRWWVAASALSLGCAFLTRYDTGVLLPLIPLYLAASRVALRKPFIHPLDTSSPRHSLRAGLRLAWDFRRDKHLLRNIGLDWGVYIVALVPVFAAAGLWNYARFGSFTKTGIPPTFGEPILQGLTGLVLSPGKGILWYMPIIFILPFVVTTFYRQHRLITLLFASIVIVELVLFSNVIYWHGDPAWGPRYIYSTVPFLVLPLGIVLERWPSLTSWAKRGFIAVVALSFAIQVVGVITPPYRFWYKEIHSQLASGQGFHWGYFENQFWYLYYWEPARSPIVIGFQNLYEITALRVFGDSSYDLQASPIPNYLHYNLSNPVHSYEINNYNLWWMGTNHPLFGTRKDVVLAALWLLLGAGTLVLLRRQLAEESSTERQVVVELKRRPA